ncbi:MAG: N-acetylmuramoyl-L-alanine amidase [Gemmatimonadales bacterium]|nr:N-acetylmuramoyl-L-alanine amidase [Gemmatimonadales bacterium]MDZ4389869.1 N-acetylmuramoyl-L-alanine amidase [Gemmatimonadales bacterium]
MMVLAWLLTAALVAPERLQVTSPRGTVSIALRQDPVAGALVPLAPLAKAIGATVEIHWPWVHLSVATGRFRLLIDSPLVEDGRTIRMLPSHSVHRQDTVWVPLAFVAGVIADPEAKRWNYTAASATLAEGPPLSAIVSRPATTTIGRETRARLPSGLRTGHRVTIDPGHGGTDPGNPGRYFPKGITEKNVTLAVGLQLRDELERRGVAVTMTRTTDTLINLGHRAPRYCRDDCDLFVSVHVNALDPRPGYEQARGFETFFLAEARTADAARVAAMENEALQYEIPEVDDAPLGGLAFMLKDLQTNEYLRESARAAQLMQSHMREVHEGLDRGVKQAGFAVLNTARRPAVLVELGFGTNREDARLLTSRDGQRSLATALADAIVAYLREHERKVGELSGGDE